MIKIDSGKKIFLKGDCTICKTCEFLAPSLFMVPEGELSARVIKDQPTSQEEITALTEALKKCPVHIIHYKQKES